MRQMTIFDALMVYVNNVALTCDRGYKGTVVKTYIP